MQWPEIDVDNVWTLPAARSKTKTDVRRPLSKHALAILNAQPRIDGAPIFSTNGGITPIKSFSLPKEKLDRASGVADWRLHDLRRTARSLLSRAGINSDLAERALGHAPPTIVQTYNRYEFVDELRHAFEALAALIDRIVSGVDAAVIPIRR